MSFMIILAPLANQVICRHCTHSVFVLQLRNHKFRKPQYLKGLLATLPNLFPTGEYYLYYHDIIPIFQGCLLHKHPSKHRQKLSQMCRNTMDNWPQEVFYSLPSDRSGSQKSQMLSLFPYSSVLYLRFRELAGAAQSTPVRKRQRWVCNKLFFLLKSLALLSCPSSTHMLVTGKPYQPY